MMESGESQEKWERRRRTIYADLLVDTVRRHSLLPSDLMDRMSRLEKTAATEERPRSATWMQAVNSSRPLNNVANAWWFFTLCFFGSLIIIFFVANGLPWRIAEGAFLRLCISPFLYGGQPLPGGRGPVFRLVPESKINSSAHGLPLGFAASHTIRSSMSHCGLASPPKLVIDNEDGSMTLTYPPENRPDTIHGMFFVPGTCNNDGQDAANCLADTSYRLQVADGSDLSVSLKAGTETRSDFKATHYHALHTPWPAYFVPGGEGIIGCCGLGAVAVFWLMGKTHYTHAVFLTSFWLTFLISVIGNIGYIYGEVDGIHAKDLPTFQKALVPNIVARLWLAVMMTFFPRFPDVWVSVPALLRVPVIFEEQVFLDLATSIPSIIYIGASAFGSCALLAIRLKLICTCLRDIRNRRIEYAAAWQSMVFTSPDCEQQLARLGQIVEELELSIPTGTVARQFKLRSSDEYGGDHGHGRHSPSGRRSPSGRHSPSGAKPRRTNSRPSTANSQTTTVSADSRTSDKDDKSTSLPVLSAIMQQLHAVADPRALLSAAPSQRLVSRRGIEPMLAAAVMLDSYVHDPMSPMTSFDQLWTQATLLQGSLLQKVMGLAHRFNGFFPVRDEPDKFERSQDKLWAPCKGRLVMGGVKSIERGIEKVDVAYGGDVSRVLDVCRERIVFESIKDMGDCLEALMADPEVSVVRVKSSMTRPGLNPVVNTGLQFISVNMRIQNSSTKRLAVSAHVCEVLFMLRSAAQASIEHHKDYIGNRNGLAPYRFTIIPGSDLKHEGKRLLLTTRQYLADLVGFRRNDQVLPVIDLGLRPSRGILRVKGVSDLDEDEEGPQISIAARGTVRLSSSSYRGVDYEDEKEPQISIGVQGGSFGRTTSSYNGHDAALDAESGVREVGGLGATGRGSEEAGVFTESVSTSVENHDVASVKSSPQPASLDDCASGNYEGVDGPRSCKPLGDTSGLSELDSAQQPGQEAKTTSTRVRFSNLVDLDATAAGNDMPVEWQTSYGLTLSHESICKLECICRIASLGLAQSLDKAVSDVRPYGISKTSLSATFFMTDATTMAASRWVQAIFVFIGCYCVYAGLDCRTAITLPVSQGSLFSAAEVMDTWYTQFKYTSLADREGQLFPEHPGVAEFGIMHEYEGDCSLRDSAPGIFNQTRSKYDEVKRATRREGASIIIDFEGPVTFSGWYLKSTKGGVGTSDFDIYARKNESDSWRLVGRPAWVASQYRSNVEFIIGLGPYAMPTNEEVILFEPTLVGALQNFPRPIFGYGISMFLFGMMGFFRFYDWAPVSFVPGCFVVFLSEIVTGGQRSITDPSSGEAAPLMALGICRTFCLIMAPLFSTWKRPLFDKYDPGMFQSGCLHLASVLSLIHICIDKTGKNPMGPWNLEASTSGGIILVIWGIQILAWVIRFMGRKRALSLIKHDQSVYEELWKVHRSIEKASIEQLTNVVESLGLNSRKNSSSFGPSNPGLHQCNRKSLQSRKRALSRIIKPSDMDVAVSVSISERGLHTVGESETDDAEETLLTLLKYHSEPGKFDEMSQVLSYGQLYVQALLVHDILRGKVKEWALKSQGYLPIVDEDDPEDLWGVKMFFKWGEVADDPRTSGLVEWPCIKRSTRSFQKVARVYNKRVSRLLDVTRFSIFFDCIDDLTVSLQNIMIDPSIQLLRVKNSLAFDADVSKTAGYRCVCLNLRVMSEETKMLGCEAHICEVQLLLLAYGDTRSKSSHTRYVLYRDLQAE